MREQKVWFKNSKGQKLAGILYNPKRKSPAIIICHGFHGSKDEWNKHRWAKDLYEKGFLVLAFDFSGNGESDGELEDFTVTKGISDLKAAVKYIKSNYSPTSIGLLGHSVGALVALEYTIHNKINVMVLLSTTANILHWLKRLTSNKLEEWRESGVYVHHKKNKESFRIKYSFFQDALKYNAIIDIKKVNSPVLFITPEKQDEYTLLEDTKKMINNANNPKKAILIKGVNHWFEGKRFQENKHFIDWFNKYLK